MKKVSTETVICCKIKFRHAHRQNTTEKYWHQVKKKEYPICSYQKTRLIDTGEPLHLFVFVQKREKTLNGHNPFCCFCCFVYKQTRPSTLLIHPLSAMNWQATIFIVGWFRFIPTLGHFSHYLLEKKKNKNKSVWLCNETHKENQQRAKIKVSPNLITSQSME